MLTGQPMLERVVEPMLRAREALSREFHVLHRAMLAIVREDAVCRRLMTVPGVGALVAITFTSAVDDPTRFTRSRAVGAHFGLTPKRYQSGETDVVGRITKVGDGMVRSILYEAAHTMLTRSCRFSSAQALGHGGGQAAWSQAGDGGTGPQALGRAAAHLDERGRVPLRQGSRRGVSG